MENYYPLQKGDFFRFHPLIFGGVNQPPFLLGKLYTIIPKPECFRDFAGDSDSLKNHHHFRWFWKWGQVILGFLVAIICPDFCGPGGDVMNPGLPSPGNRFTVGRRALDLAMELAKAIKLCIWEVLSFRAGWQRWGGRWYTTGFAIMKQP